MSAAQPPEPPEVEYRRPAWIQPPADVVPEIVPVELVLARTPQRAIGLTGIRAYPNGFGCTLHFRLHEVIPAEQSLFGMFDMFGELDPGGEGRRLARGRDRGAGGTRARHTWAVSGGRRLGPKRTLPVGIQAEVGWARCDYVCGT